MRKHRLWGLMMSSIFHSFTWKTMAQTSSFCSFVVSPVCDTYRNVSWKLFEILCSLAMSNHKIRKMHSVRLFPLRLQSPSYSSVSFLQTLGLGPKRPLYIYVPPWHTKESHKRRRSNKISGSEAALSEVIPHTYTFLTGRSLTQPFLTFLTTIYKHFTRLIWKTCNYESCSSYNISLCHMC